MLGFWIMLGLTGAAIILLILNLTIFKRTIAEKKKLSREASAAKEEIFQRNVAAFGLSAREVEVLLLILDGHTYKSAGETLFISEKTVDSHMRNVYSKVGVRNKISLYHKLYGQN
jgi:DNA-binding CsgD family transcriptional regulator